MSLATFIQASAHSLPMLPDGGVQMIATSPPYYGLRAYAGEQGIEWPAVTFRLNEWVEPTTVEPMTCGLGMEPNPVAYLAHLILCLREWKRVLRDDGTVWVNLGDSYHGGKGASAQAWSGSHPARKTLAKAQHHVSVKGETRPQDRRDGPMKPKDLLMIPAMFAIAARADGWWLRSDIVWCLSGGTLVYARTQKGDMPMTIKDMARLDPATVQLWNGHKWTQLLGMSKSARKSDEVEIVLRSGERISCTPTHRFPTWRGLLEAGQIVVGDVLTRVQLPEPEREKDGACMGTDAAWFAGLYLAEGSRSGDTIQIAGHVSQVERLERVRAIAAAYGCSVTCTNEGNKQSIRVYGKVMNAIIDTLVTGRTAHDKGFAPVVWRYSNHFIRAMLDGYLSGDGHWDAANNRWRLAFTRNYNLERDLRTACARLGWRLVLNLSTATMEGRTFPTFRGEIRMSRSGHFNERDSAEVVEIRKARCREVYDLGVADEPHLFALASGVLTHNSKPNPMPESVTDRPTKAHEYIFLLAKSARYYWDADAVREPHVREWDEKNIGEANGWATGEKAGKVLGRATNPHGGLVNALPNPAGRNLRTVWNVSTSPFPGAHFACWPERLVEPMIKAGTSERGACPQCGKPWERVTERIQLGERDDTGRTHGHASQRMGKTPVPEKGWQAVTNTLTWQPSCTCSPHEPVPCVVLDPFSGSGTTCKVAVRLGRRAIGIDVSAEYLDDVTAQRFGGGVQMELVA